MLGLFGLALGFLMLRHNTPPASLVMDFAYEYGNIAESLVSGKGFSNPFGYESGPTAWMPPVPVLIYSLVFLVFGAKTVASAYVLLALKAVGLTVSLGVLLRLSRESQSECSPWRLVALFSLAVLGHFYWLTRDCADQWMVILLSTLSLLCLSQLRRGESQSWHRALAFALPLTSPTLAFGFGLLLAYRALRGRQNVLPLLAATFLAVALWTIRNAITMGAFYPLKSNMGYEFYQANAWTESGRLTSTVLARRHPIHPGTTAALEFQSASEVKVCAAYRSRSWYLILEQTGSVASKIIGRASNAFLCLRSVNDYRPARVPINERDLATLEAANLVKVDEGKRSYWLTVDLSDGKMERLLKGLNLAYHSGVRQSWQSAKKFQDERSLTESVLLWGLLYALLPTVTLLLGLKRGGLHSTHFAEALTLYLCYLMPYVLVSHYERYQVSAVGLQVWLVWLVFFSGKVGKLSSPELPAGVPGEGAQKE